MSEKKILLGRVENISINGVRLRAKIDTGAYSCSIDKRLAEKINLGPIIRIKKVKSAHGEEYREMVKARIKTKGITKNTQLTISNRHGLRNKVLIGRKFLNKTFIIDPQKCESE